MFSLFCACFVPSFLVSFLFAPLLTCSCMCLCVLVCVIKDSSYPQSCAGSHSSLYMRSQVPFRNFAWWYTCRPYSNLVDLWISNPNPHLSFEDTLACLFVCLITCLFAPFHASFPLLACHACLLSAFYTCLFISFSYLLVLHFHCLLHVSLGALTQLTKCKPKSAKTQAKWSSSKRAMISRLGGLASSNGFLSLS